MNGNELDGLFITPRSQAMFFSESVSWPIIASHGFVKHPFYDTSVLIVRFLYTKRLTRPLHFPSVLLGEKYSFLRRMFLSHNQCHHDSRKQGHQTTKNAQTGEAAFFSHTQFCSLMLFSHSVAML